MNDAPAGEGTQQETRFEVHELPFEMGSNRAARVLLAGFLRHKHLDAQVVQDAAIVLGELVANGLDHGRPDRHDGLEVSWALQDEALEVSVLDGGGETEPHVMPPDVLAARGRGLAMVEALASRWWVDHTAGTRVTAVLPLA